MRNRNAHAGRLARFGAATLAAALAGCGGAIEGSFDPAPMEAGRSASLSGAGAAMGGSAAAQALRTDTFSGKRDDYQVALSAGVATVTRIATGERKTVATGVHRLRFADGTLVIDLEGNGGAVYRVYQAAFDRTPDTGGYAYWLRAVDAGANVDGLAREFVRSDEFRQLYGAAPSNSELLSRYYKNMLHRQPDAAGFAYWLDKLDSGAISPAAMLAYFSDSAENKAQVQAAIRSGIWVPDAVAPLTDAVYTVNSVGTSVQAAPAHSASYACGGAQCQAILSCEPAEKVGDMDTLAMRIVLDPAQRKSTIHIGEVVAAGSYEPAGDGRALVSADFVFDEREVFNDGQLRYFSAGLLRVELQFDPATERFTGTMLDRVSNRWNLDAQVATCTSVSRVTAVPNAY